MEYQGNRSNKSFSEGYDKLESLKREYHTLPNSQQRIEVIQEFIAEADRLKYPKEQLIGRYELAWTYVFATDPAKALPVCAEYMGLQNDNPGASGEVEGAAVVSISMLAASLARRLPQIPLEQCKALLAEFRRQVDKYGLGERLWQCHAAELAMMTGDLTALKNHLDKFRTALRDEVSDCEVCETAEIGEFMMALGRNEDAAEIAADLLEKGKYCEEQPWRLLSILADDALNKRDTDSAERFATAMLIQPITKATQLRCAGTLLRMEAAFSAGQDGIDVFEKCLPWSYSLWDKELLFYFYIGSSVFFSALDKQKKEVSLSLDAKFPLYEKNGIYSCHTLAEWFKNQAEIIAEKFDNRNGNNIYKANLNAALC